MAFSKSGSCPAPASPLWSSRAVFSPTLPLTSPTFIPIGPSLWLQLYRPVPYLALRQMTPSKVQARGMHEKGLLLVVAMAGISVLACSCLAPSKVLFASRTMLATGHTRAHSPLSSHVMREVPTATRLPWWCKLHRRLSSGAHVLCRYLCLTMARASLQPGSSPTIMLTPQHTEHHEVSGWLPPLHSTGSVTC